MANVVLACIVGAAGGAEEDAVGAKNAEVGRCLLGRGSLAHRQRRHHAVRYGAVGLWAAGDTVDGRLTIATRMLNAWERAWEEPGCPGNF